MGRQKPLACRLAKAGYTVWAPFLRGYAPTPLAHDGRYDLLALTEDIRHLLSAEAIGNCVLVGLSWGAVIAYAVSSHGSNHINRVLEFIGSTVSVFLQATLPLSRQLWRSRYMLIFKSGIFLNMPNVAGATGRRVALAKMVAWLGYPRTTCRIRTPDARRTEASHRGRFGLLSTQPTGRPAKVVVWSLMQQPTIPSRRDTW